MSQLDQDSLPRTMVQRAAVYNVHERMFAQGAEEAGTLLDSLASTADRLWPSWRWPPQQLDRPLAVGARGGHGPIRYFVTTYSPGSKVVYEFTAPRGLIGTHGFEVIAKESGVSAIRYTLAARTVGAMRLAWPLVWRPMHDALIEDALDTAEASLNCRPVVERKLAVRVRLLRALARRLTTRGRASAPRDAGEKLEL